jgi:gluconolactonase
LFRTELDGRITRLTGSHGGCRLNSPNDVVVKSDGTIWFTDPLYGIQTDYEGGRQVSEQPPALYRFAPESGRIEVATGDFDGPNGLAFSPDERRLYVSETGDQTTDEPRQYILVLDEANELLADGTAQVPGLRRIRAGCQYCQLHCPVRRIGDSEIPEALVPQRMRLDGGGVESAGPD